MPMLICPNCNVGMTQVQRSGVELDVCPQCRSVWLDRGELEKLLQPLREIDTAAQAASASPGASQWSQAARQPSPYRQDGYGHHGNHESHGKHGHHGSHGEYKHGSEHQYQKNKGWKSILDVFD